MKPVFRRLLPYARPQLLWITLGLLGMLLFAASEVAVARLIQPLTDGSFVQRDPQVIRWMPFAILGIFLLRGVVGFAASYSMARAGLSVVSALRQRVFAHLLRLPVSYYDHARLADVQAKISYHAAQIGELVSQVLASGLKGLLTAIGLLGYMLYVSPKLTLFALVIAPLVSASVTWVNRRFRLISQRIQSSMGDLNHSTDEAVTGRRVLKVYGGEQHAMRQFAALDRYLCQQGVKLTAANASSYSLLELIAAVGVSMLVAMATTPDMLKTMTPGTFVSFIGAMLMLRQPLSAMTGLSERFQRGMVAAEALFEFLDTPTEDDRGSTTLVRAQGALEFRDVRFRYPSAERPALDGITLSIRPGQTVAFVGRSGSGKSSLLSLIPRFYDPQQGQILLDGKPLADYPLADLRAQIALVDQQVVLFQATVAQNIAFGQPQASAEAIADAARRAHALEFIERLPQGLESPIGADGGNFSGGQRQRLAIARALLKDAPILILDEATSALDTESERAIQAALNTLRAGRTTLVIAHRLSTIVDADWIVVMDQGRIVEQGRHSDLLAQNGAYAALHRLQFAES